MSILLRAGYKMETMDVSELDEDDSCTHYLGDSTNANSLCALVPVETRPSGGQGGDQGGGEGG